MSGRAGRRGLDDTGVVIIACSDEAPDQSTISRIVLGTPTKLQSQFRLTYNMILNLLRVEALKVEDMIKRSFSENVSQKLLPEQEKQLGESTKTLKAFKGLNCNICNADIHEYYDISAKVMILTHELRELIVATPVGSKSLSSGRVVLINNLFYRNTVAVILAAKGLNASRLGDAKSYSLLVLDHKRDDDNKGKAQGLVGRSYDIDLAPLPVCYVDVPETVSHDIVTLFYTDISIITKYDIRMDDPAGTTVGSAQAVEIQQRLLEIAKEMTDKDDLAELDWSKIRDMEFQERYRDKRALMRSLKSFDCVHCPSLVDHVFIST
jgi:antiviral helicase SKI2